MSRLARVLDGEPVELAESPTFESEDELNNSPINGISHKDTFTTTGDISNGKGGNGMPGMCIECEDQPANLFCLRCADDYCDVCFQSLHRKGSRRAHQVKQIGPLNKPNSSLTTATGGKTSSSAMEMSPPLGEKENDEDGVVMTAEEILQQSMEATPAPSSTSVSESFTERAKFIPLRLNLKERKMLRLLDAALTVSEYTDKIDVVSYRSNKNQRILSQIKDLCAILCGLVVAADYQTGQELIQDKDYKFNESFFRRVFEIGRRHKIMNPEKMRTTYGKLMYLLMDSQMSDVQELLEFSCVESINTVYSVLQDGAALKMLEDPLMEMATREIIPDAKSRREIQSEIKQKERAIEALAKRYSSKELSDETIRQCLYSIGDNNSFLRGNRTPIDKMIDLLQEHFSPTRTPPSLAIAVGKNGARLSHSHERQYYYVLQSLTLWREINHHMFKLWYLSDTDMLAADNMYRLRDTGQGLNRVQHSPNVSREIHRILGDVMRRVGSGNWVGSSVVHLGDTNVPNALMFIDKYTQVARILSPIVLCIEKIDSDLVNNPQIKAYIKSTFGSADQLKKMILSDFFRHGFDGSGADNFFDAGSCIDGRLTSAWNWCHSIEKKEYFPIFLLTGFVGFDGEF